MTAASHKLPDSPATVRLESPFDLLLNAVPNAMALFDSEGRIAFINEPAEGLFGYSNGELLGKPSETLFPPRSRNTLGGSAQTESFGLRKDNSEFPLEICRKPLQDEFGGGTLIVFRDLTEQKHLQHALKEKSAALESVRQEFQSFSHSISHDLRAPLRAMDGFANMLKRSLGANLATESAHAFARIHENVSRMSKLIDGLLDFSALSWLALTKKQVNPRAIAQKSFEAVSLSEKDRQIDFSVAEMPACEADSALLRRLFDNLLSNALKFTRKQQSTVIRVGCRQENGEHVYFVQDNGAGFDMDYAGKLFHAFQRLHSESEFEGTGMGLAIAQRIVQRHGGRIWAEGHVDRGATFSFMLGNSGYGHSA